MATFTTPHQSLIVYGDGFKVQFVSGTAEADGKAAKRLAEVAEQFGIVEEKAGGGKKAADTAAEDGD